jgi:ribosome-associated protein
MACRMRIDPKELQFEFFRSSGPGGQNVNKVSTAVRLRFDVGRSPSLPYEVKERLIRLAGSKVTEQGVLLIEAHRFRTQERNRQDALDRLASLIDQAWKRPVHRRPTKPTQASRERRLKGKKLRATAKHQRKTPSPDRSGDS